MSEQKIYDQTLTTRSSGSSWDEAWVHEHSTGDTAQITSLAGKMCNRTYVYELLVADFGADNLTEQGLTDPSKLGNAGSTCQFYAAKGVIGGAGTIDLGDNGASISGDGRCANPCQYPNPTPKPYLYPNPIRFVVFGTNYDVATIRGTYEAKSAVSARNAFIFDSSLGSMAKVAPWLASARLLCLLRARLVASSAAFTLRGKSRPIGRPDTASGA